jgi:hypothetical protein
MGLLDKVKSALHGKGDQAAEAIDKAADMIDDKTGSKHSDKIDTVADKAKEVVDKLDDSDGK